MAKAFKAELDAGDVLSLYRLRKADGDEGRMRLIATEFRALCSLQRPVKIPKQYQAITKDVRTPFVRDAWHRITSSLVAKPPVVHITPKDLEKKDYREASSAAERFDLAMIERINKERGSDIIYNLTAQLVRDGESVLKVVHRPDAWANFPKRESDLDDVTELLEAQDDYKRGADLPIAWRDVDRMSVVYEGGEYGDEWVLEYAEYTKPYLKGRYDMVIRDGRLVDPASTLEGRPMPEGLKASSTGYSTKVEYFDAREWHVIIDGTEAPDYPKANPYSPYLPYFRAPAYDSESLLYSLMFLVPRLDELLTMKLNWSYLGAYPIPIISTAPNQTTLGMIDGPVGNPGDASTAMKEQRLRFEPGKAMELPVGKQFSFASPPPIGKDLNDMVSIFKGLIDTAGIPSVMRGVSGGSGESGYLANQLRAAAQMAYKLAALAQQRQLEKALEFTHWMVAKVIQQKVYVIGWDSINRNTGKPSTKAEKAWLGLSPEGGNKHMADLSKLGPIDIKYRAQLPTDEQAAAMVALQLTNAAKPLYDRRHALEVFMQEEDPDSILDAMYVEEAMNQSPLKEIVVADALRESGIGPPQGPVGGTAAPPLQPGMPPGQPQVPLGMPGQPGLNMPIQQPPPKKSRGIPNAPGGRPAGMFPGQPGGRKR